MFLRGINVGGIRVPMPELRKVLADAGCRDVMTWLATGNVRLDFDGSADELKTVAERAIGDAFDYEAYVLVREAETVRDLVENWPFTLDDAHHRYIVLGGGAAFEAAQAAIDASPHDEHVAVFGDDLYWRCLKGSTTSTPVAKLLAKREYKATTTTRNLNTLEKMVPDQA